MLAGIGIGTELALTARRRMRSRTSLQGAAADVGRLGPLYDRQVEMHRSRRTLPEHAVDHRLRHRGASDLGISAHFGVRDEVHDLRCRGPADSPIVWFLLAAGSAGVFLHAGIKFPWFVFFQKDSGLRPPDPPWNMRAAMLFFAALCFLFGVAPGLLYSLLPYRPFAPYTGDHVVTQLQLLLLSGLAFFLLLGWLRRTLTVTLDTDWFYRRAGAWLATRLDAIVRSVWRGLAEMSCDLAATLATRIAEFARHGVVARHPPDSGTMALVAGDRPGPRPRASSAALTSELNVENLGIDAHLPAKTDATGGGHAADDPWSFCASNSASGIVLLIAAAPAALITRQLAAALALRRAVRDAARSPPGGTRSPSTSRCCYGSTTA